MKNRWRFFGLAVMGMVASAANSQAFELGSNDLKPKSVISEEFIYQGFGCNGQNHSPELHWKNVPQGTKSFAVTVYDPMAPTGSGWWHWIVVDLPAQTRSLERNMKASDNTGLQISTDFGTPGYGGPCPPPGKPHPYIFTIHAVKVEKLDIPAGATNAYVRFVLESVTLKKASFTAYYGRKK